MGFKDIRVRKSEFVTKIPFLYTTFLVRRCVLVADIAPPVLRTRTQVYPFIL